jgi:hypothetical protein
MTPSWQVMVATALTAVTPVLVPLIVAALKATITVPAPLRPAIAIVTGALIDLVNAYLTGGGVGPAWGAVLGAAGIVVREILVAIRKEWGTGT